MTDEYLSPEVYWYGRSSEALPPSFGEELIEDEARIREYREAGLHAEAERQIELVARRKESLSQQALAQYYRPVGDDEELLRQHFPTRIDPGDYQGEGDTGVPAEVRKKLIELRQQKLAALDEELLSGHQDEPIFDKVKFWVANDGEVLVVACKKFGELKHWYMLAQWRPDGMPHTRPEELADRKQLEEQQLEARKAIGHRQRVVFGVIQFVVFAAYMVFAILMLTHGYFLWVCITVLWYMGLSSLITSARDRRIKSLTQ